MSEIEIGDALDLLAEREDDSAECAIVDFPWEMDIKNGTGRFGYRGSAERAPSNGYRVTGHDGEMFDQIEDAAFSDVVEELTRVLRPGSWVLCFADDRFQDPVRQTLRDVDGVTFRRNWSWSPHQMGMGYYGRVDHYPILAATIGETDRYVTGRGTLYRVKNGRQTEYPTGKPVDLYRRLLAPPVLQPGDTLLEPFCGHAPGAKVAHERGVDYWGADTNPEAVEIARERLEQQCIGQATLGNGEKMTEIPSREVWCMSCGETAAGNDRDPDRFAETHTESDCPAGEPVIQRSNQDELLEVARDAGMPVQDEVKTVGKCANPNCDEELPDKGPKKMNLGVDSGYCGLACMLEDEDE